MTEQATQQGETKQGEIGHPKVKCHKCHKEMTTTPICIDCGIIPLAEGEFERKDAEIARLKNACQGINPETVPEMMDALQNITAAVLNLNINDAEYTAEDIGGAIKRAQAAMAKSQE